MEPRPYGRGDAVYQTCTDCGIFGLQWSHGHTAVETRHRVGRHRIRMRSFNGATAIRPWRPAPRPHAAVAALLQWSHGHTAVETVRQPSGVSSMRSASMEPRPYGRGDVGERVASFVGGVRLQWSHGHTAVETRT